MTSTEAAKQKFRRSIKWKKFRAAMKLKQKVCAVSGKPLMKTANLHHLCLKPNEYENINNEEHFVFLNKQAHEVVHWLWGKGNNDWRGRLDNLRSILEKMEKLN